MTTLERKATIGLYTIVLERPIETEIDKKKFVKAFIGVCKTMGIKAKKSWLKNKWISL